MTPIREGSGNINSSSPFLVIKSDTLSLLSDDQIHSAVGESELYFCNRCQSHLFTITLSLSASAGLCLVNQLMKTLQKNYCF